MDYEPNCIFCKISKKEIPSHLIDENDKFFAIMDLYPPTFNKKITMPNVLIITKKHYSSNIFENMDNTTYLDMMLYAKKIAKAIQKALNPERVCLVYEGLEINHAHLKLYPVFKEFYPGYLSTQRGENNKATKADDSILEEYAQKIKREL